MSPSRPSLLLVCPRLTLLMCLMLLAGLAGCGPASSDNAPTLGQRVSQSKPALVQENQPPRIDFIASAASSTATSSSSLASESSMPARATIPVEASPKAAPASSTKPANPMDILEVPAWFTKDLASPNVDTRLRALDTWVLTAPVGSIDPLILAYGTDDDERVQARAMELIKQDLVRAAAAEE